MTTRSGKINTPIFILGAVVLIGIGVVFGSVLGRHERGHVTDTSTETLARIFRFDTLNSSLAYVEHTLRPAKYVNGDVRTYIVDDCTVVIGYKSDAVRNFGIENVTDHCSFDLAEFYPQDALGSVAHLTFGKLVDRFGQSVWFLPECLSSCGNAADPAMNAFYSGSHAENSIEIMVSTEYPYKTKDTDQKFRELMDKMTADHDLSYLTSGKGDCDRGYQNLERDLFKAVPIRSVTVGWDLDRNPARCAGRT